MSQAQLGAVVFDCGDPLLLASFWSVLLDVPIEQSDDDWVDTKAIGGGGMKLGFQRVPEGKVVKNRLHLDLDVPDLEAWTLVAEELGGRRQGAIVEEQGDRFQVMNYPEGNEFCLVCFGEDPDE